MTFWLGKCKVYISPLFPGLITLLLFVDTTGMMSRLLLAIAVHEGGHWLFLKWFNCMPKAVMFYPFEVNMVAGTQPLFAYQQILISCGGVLANLVLAAITGGALRFANLFLALFNLLPIYSMDGYQLLELGLGKHPRFLAVLSAVTVGGICFVGIWLFCIAQNPMLLLFGLYLGVLQIRRQRHS